MGPESLFGGGALNWICLARIGRCKSGPPDQVSEDTKNRAAGGAHTPETTFFSCGRVFPLVRFPFVAEIDPKNSLKILAVFRVGI